MLPLRLTIEEIATEDVLPLRTQVLRPHFDSSQLAHFDGDDAANTHHFAALDDGQVVAVVSYFSQPLPEDGDRDNPARTQPAVRLRGMAVTKEFRRQGVGSHLLTATLGRLPLLYPTCRWIWCNARQNVVPFYQHHGFETFGAPFTLEAIGPHRRMKRRLPTAIA